MPTADGDREIGIVRAHLEEDAAKTVHAGGATGRSVGADYSLVDFNRGGTPLLEIVSEPDLRSADEAMWFLRLLRQTIAELGVSDAEMEKGTLRADVNVSVRKRGEEGYRPRWEIKNMNSFTFIGRAIEAAFRQQVEAHEAGETLVQSTYDYDPDTDRLTVHRSKEEADDYRYFPEPDLVPVEPPAELVERLRGQLTRAADRPDPAPRGGARLRRGRRARDDRQRGEGRGARGGGRRVEDGGGGRDEPRRLPARERACAREDRPGERHARGARRGVRGGGRPARSRRTTYLAQTALGDESELAPIIDAVLAANPDQVETYRGGKEGVLGFLVGQVMSETQGKADPKVVNRLLRERLQPG